MSNFYSVVVDKPYYLPKYGGDIVKLAVRLDTDAQCYIPTFKFDESAGLTKLLDFEQKLSLADIVQDLCNYWKIDDASCLALRLTTRDAQQEGCLYINEQNRTDLRNGDLLLLTVAPDLLCQQLLKFLNDDLNDERKLENALKALNSYSRDETVVCLLKNLGALKEMSGLIESGQLANLSMSSAYLLGTFWNLMTLGQESWESVSDKLIHEVALFVIGGNKIIHPKGVSVALTIIEAVANTSSKFEIVEKEVPVDNLIILLYSSDYQIQHNTLAVINAIFGRVDASCRMKMFQLLTSSAVRNTVLTNLLRDRLSIGAELAHQLHILQRNIMNTYEIRCSNDGETDTDVERLEQLKRLTFDSVNDSPALHTASSKIIGSLSKDFARLGFANHRNPAEDLHNSTWGRLSLDCMIHFASKHASNFAKILMTNAGRWDHCKEWPLAQCSLKLTSVLAEICQIGEPPSEEGQQFYLVFFTHENPFEELFSLAIMLMHKTWKEMKANLNEDMDKVLRVVREQITRSLQQRQHSSFESLESEFKNYPYSEILKLWDQEIIEQEESEFSLPSIIELKSLLKPRIASLVRLNRMNALKAGQKFAKYGRGPKGYREKGKFWFWRLLPGEKSLVFCDCSENNEPKFEEMKDSLDVEDIAEIRYGTECPLAKSAKHKTTCDLAFSIILRNAPLDDCYNFVASDPITFNTWIDGLRALIGLEMTSENATHELELLLNLDIKTRLMNLEEAGIRLADIGTKIMPTESPPVSDCGEN